MDAYLGQLGKRTRADLRRNERMLLKAIDGRLEHRRFTDAGSVPELLEMAEQVSRKTYQRGLGLGIDNTEARRQKLMRVADLGWLRSYVLSCAGEPAAFMVGYQYDDTYYSSEIGYDPRWRQFSVGNVLHCHVVRDLIESRCVRVFDFMYGDNENKSRLSNRSRLERHFYLFPRSLWGRGLAFSLRGMDRASRLARRAAERLTVARQVRTFIRSLLR
jgi:hypothetical protein